jgi:RimJ/RimL family protein N-acetyltransferase
MDEITTPRLRLREFRADDVDAFRRFVESPEYRRHLSADHPDVEQFVANNLGTGRRSLAYVIERDGTVVGSVFLGVGTGPDRGELACLIDPTHWRLGIGREACRAVIAYAFEHRLIDRVWAGADLANTSSIRGMEALGMRRELRTSDRVVYSVTAPD